jgi:hypothetical protein
MSTSASEAQTEVQPAIATVAGDQCTSCSAPLAPDQRYCVHCGQRRGGSAMPRAEAAITPAEAAPVPRPRGARMSVNSTLIAGIGTLLLAMGVGVLIGRSGQKSSNSSASAPAQIITVGGGGGATALTGSGSSSASKSKSKGGKNDAAAKSTSTKAPATVKGTDVKLPKQKVVTVGSKGSGPGYQHGKFTGNFFGGG